MDETAVSCKFLADRDNLSTATIDLGINVDYVGEKISDLIKNGYIPMIW